MLPRLLYIGGVPVEAGMGGSGLIYRLLCEYPPERLMIVQGREGGGFERLTGVPYKIVTPPHFFPSRWEGLQAVASVAHAHIAARSIAAQIEAFRPNAVVTVTHGWEWIAAWRVARRLGLPLHLISHDDWEPTLPVPTIMRGWTRRCFARAYRDAASRLCVSPYMAAHYEKQFGAPGTLLYPSRAKDVLPPEGPPEPRASNGFTVGYAGSVHAAFAPVLRALATALDAIGGRLLIYSNLSASSAGALGLVSAHVKIERVMPPVELIRCLRSETDALFLVMSEVGLNSRICFPSKLVDYTATGLPIIVSAPKESAPAYWVREHPAAAVHVDAGDNEGLHSAVVALAEDPGRRRALGVQAQQIGNAQFSYVRARDTFFAALTPPYG